MAKPINRHRLEGLRILRQEVKNVSRKDQLAIVFTHPEIKNSNDKFIELHAIRRWVTVTEEGDADYFFGGHVNEAGTDNADVIETSSEDQVEVPVIAQQNNCTEVLDMSDPHNFSTRATNA